MKWALWPASGPYKLLKGLDQGTYKWGWRKAQKLSKPVISVGNLTTGGTGKTPVVDYFLTQIEAKGKKACVLTRGYGRSSKARVKIQDQATAIVGDEPKWLSIRHPKSEIIVGANRIEGAKLASQDVDVFLLDDGFQHWAIDRDLDIVLIDATAPLSDYKPLPVGRLREGFKSLQRAQMVIVTKSNLASRDNRDWLIEKVGENFKGVIYESTLEVAGVGNNVNLGSSRVVLMSGLGNPESFETLVKVNFPVRIMGHVKFKDHHKYCAENLNQVLSESEKLQADWILTSEKDFIKIKELGASEKFCAIHTRLNFQPHLPDIYDLASHARR